MLKQPSQVLAEISKNFLTMLVISREGAVIQTKTFDASPSVEEMIELTRANSANAVTFVRRADMSEEQLRGIIASSVRERWGMRIVIADAPDKEKVFAELYHDGQIWAIVSQEEGPLLLEIYADSKQIPMKLPHEDVIDILQKAKRKLLGDPVAQTDPGKKRCGD